MSLWRHGAGQYSGVVVSWCQSCVVVVLKVSWCQSHGVRGVMVLESWCQIVRWYHGARQYDSDRKYVMLDSTMVTYIMVTIMV